MDDRPMIHEVFISAKSADYDYARQVYQFLVEHGVRAFFSQESLPELGNSDYREEIDNKLDEVQHMVVVASSVEHAKSPWVKAEWGLFINEKRSGRKTGNLVTVTVGALKPEQLPASLRTYEVIPFDPGAFEKILRYVSRGGRPADAQAAPPVLAVERPPPRRPGESFINSLGSRLVHVPQERRPESDPPDRPLYVATTCVSNRDYVGLVREGGPRPSVRSVAPGLSAWSGQDCAAIVLDHPVVFVTHEKARQFCEWLTRKERAQGIIGTGEQYLLPTSEQWKAVAAGTWLTEQTVLQRPWPEMQYQPTSPVFSGEASELGLFHVFGNVFEWCLDVQIRNVQRSDGKVYPNSPCYMAIGGGWASTFDWLQKSMRKKQYGAILCPGGWAMKDGGFRIWLQGESGR
jgi:hypothetical protein